MPKKAKRGETELLLQILDEGYERAAWHGPNLRNSLRGVTAAEARWRPGAGRHNIWELAVHAAYWKYAVRQRLTAGKRGSFEVKGSNWFRRPESDANERAWRRDLELLSEEHRKLRAAVASSLRALRPLPGQCAFCLRALRPLPGQRASSLRALQRKFVRQIFGVAFHDVYHAGQIRLLRRLFARKA